MASKTKVYIAKTDEGIKPAVDTILTQIDETRPILKGSKEVYLKVNGVHCKKNCYTNPEVLRATIEHLYGEGVEKVFVMEDSVIGNVTRLVFKLTGYTKICEETGAKPLYLDEERPRAVTLCSGASITVCARVRSIFILNLIDLKFRLFFNLKNSNHNCLYWSRIILTQNEKSFRYFMWMTTKTIL